jgi:hypothetical protein
MTTKLAALLAALGTTLELVAALIWPFAFFLGAPGAWHSPGTVLNVVIALVVLPVIVILAAALPVFFVCVYLNEPPLAVPERLQKPAFVAAFAAALEAARAAFFLIRGSVSSSGMDGWARVIGMIVVSVFFLTVTRSRGELRGAEPRLKKAAMYAGSVMAINTLAAVATGVWSVIAPWVQQILPAARGVPPATWHSVLQTSLGAFCAASLARFLLLFEQTIPTTQSSQRLSSGE